MKKVLILSFILCYHFSLHAQEIELELIKSGFSNLVNVQNAGDDRIFVVEQGGRIEILNPDGTVNPTPFINLNTEITPGGEQGLLGLAFHPDYATNGHFFVNYINNSGDTQIARYTVSSSNPNVADPASALPILSIIQPFSNHNGGDIKFGPDGFLYIATGDGGSGGDPQNNAQNRNNLLGNLLRLDVNNSSVAAPYEIPADNPFVGMANMRDEIWAYGLRNPWKFNFDSSTNDLWIADVGQNAVEEINRATPVEYTGGLNYGWRCFEGNDPFNSSNCPPSTDLFFPIASYDHPIGFSITGGYVYRGNEFQDLQGLYFFADFATSIIGTVDDSGALNNLGSFPGSWSTFYEGLDNELYICSFGGSIFRIKSTLTVGFDDVNLNNISVTPNPATTFVNVIIENDRVNHIKISDLKGSVVHLETEINAIQKNINVADYASGMYLMTITSQSGNVTVKKLMVQ